MLSVLLRLCRLGFSYLAYVCIRSQGARAIELVFGGVRYLECPLLGNMVCMGKAVGT